jgi:CheY-like chemotaxis protein
VARATSRRASPSTITRVHILLLEDDPSRVAAMRTVLTDLLPAAQIANFDNAPAAISFLQEHCAETILISLDHDLGPTRQLDPTRFDPGDGRDVISHLAACTPTCPVIVHSANYQMVPVMIESLRDAGSPATFVTPYSQLQHGWIALDWRNEIEWLVKTGQIRTT